MRPLPKSVYTELYQTILETRLCRSQTQLASLFVTKELLPHQSSLPDASSERERVARLIDLLVAKNAVTSFLAVVAHQFHPDDALRHRLARIRDALAAEITADEKPPFKGLQYFTEADAPLFFGRDTLVTELVQRLDGNRFLALVGASGSGKSSLLRAGLMARLRQREEWLILPPITPDQSLDSPLHALAAAFTALATASSSATNRLAETNNMAAAFRRGEITPLQVAADLLQQCPPASRLMVAVDQFEKLFTVWSQPAQQTPFVEALLSLIQDERSPVSLILALRADFYPDALRQEPLHPYLEQQQKIIPAMTRDELRAVIMEPARLTRLGWETGLVDTFIDDLWLHYEEAAAGSKAAPGATPESGKLPLLSFALLETYKRRDRHQEQMTYLGYHAAGGVQQAITLHAQRVYNGLTAAQQRIAQTIFIELTELGEESRDTSRRVTLWQLAQRVQDDATLRPVLDVLAGPEGRLITIGAGNEAGLAGDVVQITHESLIQKWGTLRDWLGKDRPKLRQQRQIEADADAWKQANRDDGFLYRGARLVKAQEFDALYPGELAPLTRAFLAESQAAVDQLEAAREAQQQQELAVARELAASAEARRQAEAARAATQSRASRRLRQGLAVALVFLVLALIATAWAVDRSNATRQAQAVAERQARVAQSQALAAAAETVGRENDTRALLLSIEAGRTYTTSLAYAALYHQLPYMPKALSTFSHEGSIRGAQWNQEESQLLTWSNDRTAKVWDTGTGTMLFMLTHEDWVNGAQWNQTESQLLTWSRDGTVKVWDAHTGMLLLTFAHEDWVNGAQWNQTEAQLLTWSWDGMAKLWDTHTGALLFTLTHEDWVNGVKWNQTESQLLTWSNDRTAKVWDAGTGMLRFTIAHENWVRGAQWNQTESQLLTWSQDGTAKVWDAGTGSLRFTLAHEGLVWGAQWNQTESQLLTWSQDGTAKVWDAVTGALRFTLTHRGSVRGAQWNQEESQLLTWSSDGTAKVWDVGTAALRLTLAHEGRVNGAQWNQDESQLLTWNSDWTAQVWDARAGTLVLTLSHEDYVYGAQWNQVESQLLTWSADGIAQVWDARAGALLFTTLSHEEGFSSSVKGAQWNQGESQLLTWGDDGTAKVWDGHSGVLLFTLTHEDWVNGAQWNQDESQLLTWGNNGTAKVWDGRAGALHFTLTHEDRVNGVQWNQDESQLLTWSRDGTAKVWNAPTGTLVLTLSHEDKFNNAQSMTTYDYDLEFSRVLGGLDKEDVLGAQWNQDESQLLTWSKDGTAKVWDAGSGALRFTLTHADGVNGAQWNQEESQLLTWSRDGTAKVWDARSGVPRFTLAHGGFPSSVNGAQWNQEESQLLTWSNDGTAKVWAAGTGELQFTLTHEGGVSGAQWNQEESQLLTWSRDGTAKVWDMRTGAPRFTLTHEGGVSGAQWNQKESQLLTWSRDGTAKVWDAHTGELMLRLEGDGTEITAITWNNDDTQIVLGTAGGSVKIYLTEWARLLNEACDHATRNLTWAEWQVYLPGQSYHQTCPNLPRHPSVPQS